MICGNNRSIYWITIQYWPENLKESNQQKTCAEYFPFQKSSNFMTIKNKIRDLKFMIFWHEFFKFLKQPVFFGQLFLHFKGTCLPFGGLGIFESWLQLMITSSGII